MGNKDLIKEYKKNLNKESKKKDDVYPDQYKYDYGISLSKWKKYLKMDKTTRLEDRVLLKRIYRYPDHSVSTAYLEKLMGYDSGMIGLQIAYLADVAKRKLEIEAVQKLDFNEGWKIMFWGKETINGFIFKLKPNLVKAMEDIYPELLLETGNRLDELRVQDEMALMHYDYENETFGLRRLSKPAPEPVINNGLLCYESDIEVARNATIRAGYECELDELHQTFLVNENMQGYVETIHLIPLEYQPHFKVSLDVEENVVCLCANCVKQMRYGYSKEVIIRQLFKNRRKYLENIGINITVDELLEMYETETSPEKIKEIFIHLESPDFKMMS